MNFPCPWPKRRHSGRRVAGGDFADLIASRLAPGGTFTLATDVDWYALEAGEIFGHNEAFETSPAERNGPREYATKYERKWRAMGRDIFVLKAAKKNGHETQETKEEDGSPMEEIETREKISAENFSERLLDLRSDTAEGEGFRAMFRDVFRSGESDALVKVISVDEGFEQHYFLRISLRDGRLHVRPDSVGHPYKTPAVRASVRHALRKFA